MMLDQHARIYEITRAVHLVIIGTSIRQTLMRSVVTSMTLLAGLRGQPFGVSKSVRGLAKVVTQELGRDAEEVLATLVANGIVSAEEADA